MNRYTDFKFLMC